VVVTSAAKLFFFFSTLYLLKFRVSVLKSSIDYKYSCFGSGTLSNYWLDHRTFQLDFETYQAGFFVTPVREVTLRSRTVDNKSIDFSFFFVFLFVRLNMCKNGLLAPKLRIFFFDFCLRVKVRDGLGLVLCSRVLLYIYFRWSCILSTEFLYIYYFFPSLVDSVLYLVFGL